MTISYGVSASSVSEVTVPVSMSMSVFLYFYRRVIDVQFEQYVYGKKQVSHLEDFPTLLEMFL